MIKIISIVAVLFLVGCQTFDPANYDRIHDKEFEDHLRQNGAAE